MSLIKSIGGKKVNFDFNVHLIWILSFYELLVSKKEIKDFYEFS